nr:uncharacterized protein LOC113816639 isoform X3 [Penaeus vannamei]
MKIAMVVCLCFVSTGVSATEPQVCVNVSVTPDEGPSPQYPVANGSLTELVIHAPKKDFGSVAVFLGPECLLQLRQLGAPGGWTCLFALPLTNRAGLRAEHLGPVRVREAGLLLKTRGRSAAPSAESRPECRPPRALRPGLLRLLLG